MNVPLVVQLLLQLANERLDSLKPHALALPMKVPVPVLDLVLRLGEHEQRVFERLLDWALVLDLVDEVDEVDFFVRVYLRLQVRLERVRLRV